MKLVVVGSAHLDVLAQAKGHSSAVDQMGSVSLEVGGTACNIASNAKQLDVETVVLVTAWGVGSINEGIGDFIRQRGIELVVEEVDAMTPVSAFVAHIDAAGEMKSAISAMSVDTWMPSEEKGRELLAGATALVVEANLQAEAIRLLSTLAYEQQLPCFGLAVSEDKVGRLAAGKAYRALFMNLNEATRLLDVVEAKDIKTLAKSMDTEIFVTQGRTGVNVFSPDGRVQFVPPPNLTGKKNTLGAGDAFSTAVIVGMVRDGLPADIAAEKASELVELVASRIACNPDSGDALNVILNSARHDRLTQLLQRKPFEREFRRHAGDKVLLFIDCDHFKAVNDRLGHDVGDKVLVKVAEILVKCVRSIDVVARWGGDEFVVLLTRVKSQVEAEAVVDRMIEAADSEDLHGVTFSIGLVAVEAGTTLEVALKRADRAVYRAKALGRNQYVVHTPVLDVDFATHG